MKKENETKDSSMSLSKERKLARKKEIQQRKRQARINKLIAICLIAALVIGVCSFTGYKLYREATRIVASDDYAKYLTENGLITDTDASSLVELCDYKNITVPLSEVEFSEEDIENEIQTVLDANKTLTYKSSTAIADGDKVNIDYVGSIDGVAFDGGSTEGEGTDLTIGSGDYIDGFEDQLIGHMAGDTVEVAVTFPEDYSDSDLAGKDAVFEVVINGIYIAPEFNDEFVANNLSDYASTTEEYIQYLKETNYESSLTEWVENYLIEQSSISSYPKDYTSHLESLKKYEAESTYNSMNEYLSAFGSEYAYSSFEDYIGMSESEYDKSLAEEAQVAAKQALVYQAILEKEGITVTAEDYLSYLLVNGETEEDYNEEVEEYGTNYVAQKMIKNKAIELVKELITINEEA